ncbi:tag-342 [Pristionchus pacificus]|uniref:Uncharacterized protein n=1 Tax=Pristionchus pacificus TaxID=54126 RepID=A0A8R1Z9Q4_PRIPA|nr:tag-342 [Pristionchus pacificus]
MSGRKRQLSETKEDSPAPRKKGKQSKVPSVSAEKEWAETDERLLDTTKLIMFATGDSNEPSETNARMLLALMQQQVRMLMTAAQQTATNDGRDSVTLRDLLVHFARHKLVLGRLLNHAKAALVVTSLTRHTKDEEDDNEKEEDGVPYEGESEEDDASSESESSEEDSTPGAVAIKAPKNSALAQLEEAVDSLDAGFTAADLMDASFEDLTRQARDRRMATRVRRLREDVYKEFAEARQAAFVSRQKRKMFKGQPESSLFISWLGLPPLDSVLTYVISWLAKEIVTQVVDDAYMCLLKENTSGVNRGAAASLLTAHHYEEALRKNLGWRSRGDVLFGYIAPRED